MASGGQTLLADSVRHTRSCAFKCEAGGLGALTMRALQLYSCRASVTLALALALCGLCQGITVAPFNEDCPSPVPPPSQYNKLVPDMTVVPLPMTVSLQPIMVTEVSPRFAGLRRHTLPADPYLSVFVWPCRRLQTFELTGYLFMSWTDRRLAFNASRCNRGKQRYVLTGDGMSQVRERPVLPLDHATLTACRVPGMHRYGGHTWSFRIASSVTLSQKRSTSGTRGLHCGWGASSSHCTPT